MTPRSTDHAGHAPRRRTPAPPFPATATAAPAAAAGDGDPLAALGPHLRALRTRREATLREVSEATGISVSTLSRLESGGRRPSLELLMPLAKVYGVSLDELVDAPTTGDPRIHMRPVRHEGMTMIPLTHRPGGIQAVKMIYEPGPDPTPEDLRVHDGYEWFYVLSGSLRVILGGHDLVLGAGEAAEFDCRTPHWFGATGGESVEVLSLFGPQGEKAHLRARPRRAGA
ncbi:helix-turn-helix domain-containing protein [Brachybacterium phenoliresistens]|uniref:helix-turn-helix domain-containing protein n=1 Tax=Brachybacterium phenoliresistens TaxID=396014 RepID=UPI0031E20F75